jgi:chromosome segregation ATPase
MAVLEAELEGQRARVMTVERQDKVLRAQIAREAEAAQDLKHQRDKALDDANGLKAKVEELRRAPSDIEARAEELSRKLSEAQAQQLSVLEDMKRERVKAVEEVAALNAKVEELRRARYTEAARAASRNPSGGSGAGTGGHDCSWTWYRVPSLGW